MVTIFDIGVPIFDFIVWIIDLVEKIGDLITLNFLKGVMDLLVSVIDFLASLVNLVVSELGEALIGLTSALVKITASLVSSIGPLVTWVMYFVIAVFNVRNSDYNVIKGTTVGYSPGDEGTPLWAFNELISATEDAMPAIIGPGDAEYGITYILRALVEGVEREAEFNYVASRTVYAIFDLLTWIVGNVADLMKALPELLPFA